MGSKFYIWIDGIRYAAEKPYVKTEHGKTGEVVIGGFYRVDKENDICKEGKEK